MALLFADGFDHYAKTSAPLTTFHGKWLAQSTHEFSLQPGYLSGQCIKGWGVVSSTLRRVITPADGQIIVGFRYRHASGGFINGAPYTIARLLDGEGKIIARLSITPTAQLTLGAPIGAPDTTSDRSIAYGAWNYLEFKSVAGASALRINGAPAGASASGPLYSATAFLELTGEGYFDDLYVCDASSTRNNDFLGDVRVLALRPNRDVRADFDRSNPAAPGNYAMVNDTPGPDEDATYNHTSAAGKRDLFGVAPTGLDSAHYGVKGVQVVVRARKEDSGTRYLSGVLRSGGAEANAAPKALATAEQYQHHLAEINPATSAPWTLDEVEAAAIGYDTSAP